MIFLAGSAACALAFIAAVHRHDRDTTGPLPPLSRAANVEALLLSASIGLLIAGLGALLPGRAP